MDETNSKDLMTVEEVARRLSLSRATIYAMMAAGKLGYYRVGTGGRGSRRCSEDQLAEYLAANEHPPAAAPANTERRGKASDRQKFKHLV